MLHAPISVSRDYAVTVSQENGKTYYGNHQEVGPLIKRTQKIRDMHSHSTKSSNPNEWKHIGTIPISVISKWCQDNNYTFDEWARNDGGIKGKQYPDSRSGVKDKFLAYFLSRDFAKLHNMHFTTRSESSQILVPAKYGDKREAKGGVLVPPKIAEEIKSERAA